MDRENIPLCLASDVQILREIANRGGMAAIVRMSANRKDGRELYEVLSDRTRSPDLNVQFGFGREWQEAGVTCADGCSMSDCAKCSAQACEYLLACALDSIERKGDLGEIRKVDD